MSRMMCGLLLTPLRSELKLRRLERGQVTPSQRNGNTFLPKLDILAKGVSDLRRGCGNKLGLVLTRDNRLGKRNALRSEGESSGGKDADMEHRLVNEAWRAPCSSYCSIDKY